MNIVIYRDIRWFTSSSIAQTSAVSHSELKQTSKLQDASTGDTGSYYQIIESDTMPYRSIAANTTIPYQTIVTFRFDSIIKYQLSSRISYNQVFMYMGSFFGFLICLQKLIITCYVRPAYRTYLSQQIDDPYDFNSRTTNIEMYRVHKHCENNGMNMEPFRHQSTLNYQD